MRVEVLRVESLTFKILWRILAYPALICALFSLLLFHLYTHPKRNISGLTPEKLGLSFETVTLTTSDGLKLDAWYLPNKKSGKAVIVCHGYPMDKGNVLGMTDFLAKDFNVLLFDFRAMGGSEGFFSTGGAKEVRDVDAAVAFLRSKGFDRTGLFGFSMGAATALMSENPAITARVADSPYADLDGELSFVFKDLGPLRRPLVTMMKLWSILILGVNMDRSSPLNAIADSKIPTLIIHGDKDTQVPVASSVRLKAANTCVDLWLINGADHGETRAAAGLQYETG
jgi:dipeptidyl aminopeptidase/acylaminoacyl peptidase